MRLPGYLIAFTLGVLLTTTTPVGTGAGLHQFQLLHPLFSHAHLVNGRMMTHEQMAQMTRAEPVRQGVSLGADDGASTTDGGAGVSPSVPSQEMLAAQVLPTALVTLEPLPLLGRPEAPPDPPPL